MTSIRIPHSAGHATAEPTQSRTALQRLLLIAGTLSSALYVSVDLLTAVQYPGYSLVNQAISELSAIGAPTAGFWSAMGAIYGVLIVAFSIGVFRVAGGNSALRRTGALLLLFAAANVFWRIVPMHPRGTELTWQDTGHLIMGGVSILLIVAFIGAGAFALGRRFRLYSFATLAVFLMTGAATFAYVSRMAAGEPTPWLGVVERVSIYGYLLWVAVFGIALLRQSPRGAGT